MASCLPHTPILALFAITVTGVSRSEIPSQLWYLLWPKPALSCIVEVIAFIFVIPLNAFCLRKCLLKGLSRVRDDKFESLGILWLDGHEALSVSASVRDLQCHHVKG